MRTPLIASVALLAVMAAPFAAAHAQDAGRQAGTDLVIDLGIGARLQPKYEGAESYLLSPFPIIKLSYLRLGSLYTLEDKPEAGVFFYPSFNFVGARTARDNASLTGLNSVDWAVELGAGVGFRNEYLRAFAEVRRGLHGHNGFVGEVGVDAILHPMDKVTLLAGPRMGFADGKYMDTYFGVSAAESAASGGALAVHKAGGGIKDIGLEATVNYAWTDTTTLSLEGGYRRLIADAGSSPIVKRGSADQFSIGVGVSHRFSLDLY
ncbi:MipA/OmpV family protein [Breoghania sp. L-A4]|uniref:MipA/OmpV family protein n=1 Tax=Breoghania sp. L-A4 TaxID=2304600 RepID=UPI000E35D523|nr:MipA/OmpV family protein [Breoghania sp. L-A4]AXS42276.1 MipA/OmpV family protein [Breoghania sp. L-A4]